MTKKKQPPAETPSARRGMSKEMLAERYDYKTKARAAIARALKRLPLGQVWSDSDMRSECGVNAQAGWREVAEESQFAAYQFRIGDNGYWWAQPKTVAWACTNIAKARRLDEVHQV